MSETSTCRLCEGVVTEFFDLGRQPLADAFRAPDSTDEEFFYRLAVGVCAGCSMVQLMDEVPRDRMFHQEYPYHSSGSSVMRAHFERMAKRFLETELTGDDPFIVEIGSNDGVMLRTVADTGTRHLGVEPSGAVADLAAERGIRVRKAFFEESTALQILKEEGRADVVYSANTFSHVPYVGSVLDGVRELLAPDGVFVFEDPYFADIVERASFDQIYDEHFYFFTVGTVETMAARFGLELVDAERLDTHGGEIRYTLAHRGARTPSPAVAELIEEEKRAKLTEDATLADFTARVDRNRDDLVATLTRLRDEGKRVVGYGATAKSATLLNYCGIGPDLLPEIFDSTPAKQGRVAPGTHIPVRPSPEFSEPYPDHALLLAWNHAEEIMANETDYRDSGGSWITYVPEVKVR